MQVRWQMMGTTEAWFKKLEMLTKADREREVSHVEMSLKNGPTIVVREMVDDVTRELVTSHLEVHIAPRGTDPVDIHLSPVVAKYP
jgi:hypothetical protein